MDINNFYNTLFPNKDELSDITDITEKLSLLIESQIKDLIEKDICRKFYSSNQDGLVECHIPFPEKTVVKNIEYLVDYDGLLLINILDIDNKLKFTQLYNPAIAFSPFNQKIIIKENELIIIFDKQTSDLLHKYNYGK